MATTEKCPKCGEQISTAAPLSHHCGAVAVPSQVANLCTWEADEDGIWHAACDHTSQNLYCFTEGCRKATASDSARSAVAHWSK